LTVSLTMLSNTYITELFAAVVEATEEAIVREGAISSRDNDRTGWNNGLLS
jgi:L-aminopeptidase/D-esterase-like protein